MSQSHISNIPNLIFMVRPKSFGFNAETADSNSFQSPKSEIDQEKIMSEFEGLVAVLQKNGVEVEVFSDQDEQVPDAVFSNNWISQIPDSGLFIYPMFAPVRRKEIRPDVIQHFSERLGIEVIDLSGKVSEALYLEGTGSIVFDHDHKIAYACESPRTSMQLFEELCERINYKPVSFLSVDLDGLPIYHTNVMMSVSSQYVLICLESIENSLERQMVVQGIKKSGKELIAISYPQMNRFLGNCLEVQSKDGSSLLVMSESAFKALDNKQRKCIESYSRIIYSPIPTIEEIGGGSVRCMLTGLFS